jgi:hypothetical protein
MKTSLFILFASAFLAYTSAQSLAQEAGKKENFPQLTFHNWFTPIARFDFEKDPAFSMIVQELKVVIARFRDDEEHGIDRLKRWNNFCAVGYVLGKDPYEEEGSPLQKRVIVYWQEDGSFIYWNGEEEPEKVKENFYNALSLSFSRFYSMKDAVDYKLWKTGDIFLGTGQLIREDLESILADCKKHGRHYIIGPFTPPFEEY